MSSVRSRVARGVFVFAVAAASGLAVGGCASAPPLGVSSVARASDSASPEGLSASDLSLLATLRTSWLVPSIAGERPPEVPRSRSSDAVSARGGAPARYACPMHPAEISDSAGRCSQCGMDLEAILEEVAAEPSVESAERKP